MLIQCNNSIMPAKVVEVFKTSVTQQGQVAAVLRKLLNFMPDCRINFDLEDEDNILRVEGFNVIPEHVIAVLEDSGYVCDVLV